MIECEYVQGIVVATVSNLDRNVRTRPLYQYDYGQILYIDGVTLPPSYEVHFSNDQTGSSKTQIGNEQGVVIPQEYLLTGKPVYAWVYLHNDTDDGETVYTITIPVIKRAKITEDTPTPSEESTISQLIEQMNTAVETAQAAADLILSMSHYYFELDEENDCMNLVYIPEEGEEDNG